MSTESKKHHFIPRSVLKNFSINGAGKQVFVFDKKNGSSYVSSIFDAGSENHFNTVKIEDHSVNFEKLFDDVDTKLASIINRLIDAETLDCLTSADILSLIDLVMVQYLRTKINRDTLVYIGERHKEIIEGLGPDFELDSNPLTNEESKLLTLAQFFDVSTYSAKLYNKSLFLFSTDKEQPFVISDNPVVEFNSFPYGSKGLDQKGIEIYYPISEELAIGFLCDSIFNNLKNEKPEQSTLINEFQRSRKAVPLDGNYVKLLNNLQISSSTRFVYSSTDQKSIVTGFLTKYPQYKEVKTKVFVGEMGVGPPPKKNMPNGDFLVIFTEHNHYMLSIKLVPEPVIISFFTEDYEKLRLIELDRPISKAEVYSDGKLIRSIPNGVLREVDYTGFKPNKIGFHDPALEDIMKSVILKD